MELAPENVFLAMIFLFILVLPLSLVFRGRNGGGDKGKKFQATEREDRKLPEAPNVTERAANLLGFGLLKLLNVPYFLLKSLIHQVFRMFSENGNKKVYNLLMILIVFGLGIAFYFIMSPYQKCIREIGDYGRMRCIEMTSW